MKTFVKYTLLSLMGVMALASCTRKELEYRPNEPQPTPTPVYSYVDQPLELNLLEGAYGMSDLQIEFFNILIYRSSDGSLYDHQTIPVTQDQLFDAIDLNDGILSLLAKDLEEGQEFTYVVFDDLYGMNTRSSAFKSMDTVGTANFSTLSFSAMPITKAADEIQAFTQPFFLSLKESLMATKAETPSLLDNLVNNVIIYNIAGSIVGEGATDFEEAEITTQLNGQSTSYKPSLRAGVAPTASVSFTDPTFYPSIGFHPYFATFGFPEAWDQLPEGTTLSVTIKKEGMETMSYLLPVTADMFSVENDNPANGPFAINITAEINLDAVDAIEVLAYEQMANNYGQNLIATLLDGTSPKALFNSPTETPVPLDMDHTLLDPHITSGQKLNFATYTGVYHYDMATKNLQAVALPTTDAIFEIGGITPWLNGKGIYYGFKMGMAGINSVAFSDLTTIAESTVTTNSGTSALRSLSMLNNYNSILLFGVNNTSGESAIATTPTTVASQEFGYTYISSINPDGYIFYRDPVAVPNDGTMMIFVRKTETHYPATSTLLSELCYGNSRGEVAAVLATATQTSSVSGIIGSNIATPAINAAGTKVAYALETYDGGSTGDFPSSEIVVATTQLSGSEPSITEIAKFKVDNGHAKRPRFGWIKESIWNDLEAITPYVDPTPMP